ncbi:hypothetical protein ACIQD1_17250 [Streptomyces sp. NPDC093088]|uniref:hypothetical protein n=1 Tax=Streptomyces sp. NPDC093088 TaxID=3366023 RepID=UPI0037FFC92D
MFGKSKRKTPATPTVQSDQYRLKATGQRVTILGRTSDGAVKVAMDNGRILREDIVSARDITPA